MMRLGMLSLALTLGVVAPAPAGADESPLAAAARKEQERRGKVKGSTNVLTNDDLRGAPAARAADTDEPGAAGDAKPEGTAEKAGDKADGAGSADEAKEARRAAIQAEIDAQVGRIRAVRKQIDDINRELADNTVASEGPRRQQVLQQRADGERFIAETEARISDLQDEARKLGVTVTRPQ